MIDTYIHTYIRIFFNLSTKLNIYIMLYFTWNTLNSEFLSSMLIFTYLDPRSNMYRFSYIFYISFVRSFVKSISQSDQKSLRVRALVVRRIRIDLVRFLTLRNMGPDSNIIPKTLIFFLFLNANLTIMCLLQKNIRCDIASSSRQVFHLGVSVKRNR